MKQRSCLIFKHILKNCLISQRQRAKKPNAALGQGKTRAKLKKLSQRKLKK